MTSDYDDMYGVIATDNASGKNSDIEFTQASSTSATLFALDAYCDLYVANSVGGGLPGTLCVINPDANAASLVRCDYKPGAAEATKETAVVTCSFSPDLVEKGLGLGGGSLMCTAGDLEVAVQSLEGDQGTEENLEGSLSIGPVTVDGGVDVSLIVRLQ